MSDVGYWIVALCVVCLLQGFSIGRLKYRVSQIEKRIGGDND